MIRTTRGVGVLVLLAWSGGATAAGQASLCDSEQKAALIQTVRDRTTRTPLVGATVLANWEGSNEALRLRTDSTGRARICAPADRTINLRVNYRDVRADRTTVLTLNRVTEHTAVLDVPGLLVRGSIVDNSSGTLLNSVAVRITNTALIALTNDEGRFVFPRVPLGNYTLVVEHISYAAARAPIRVQDEDLDVAFRLTPEAIALQPVVVATFSRRLEGAGFYERQKRGVGTFIGRRQIEAMNVQRASDLLRNVPSARIVPQVPRQNVPPNALTGRGQCRYRFIVDGTRTLADFEMDLVAPYAIEGVEVYNGLSEVPALFRAIADGGPPLCGVIAIWTRQGR